MPEEIERLLTIRELSELLGVPVDSLSGGAVAARVRRATRSGGTFATVVLRLSPGWRPCSMKRSAWSFSYSHQRIRPSAFAGSSTSDGSSWSTCAMTVPA